MSRDEGDAWLLEPVSGRIIGCAFRVANRLGHGFVEAVYENALAHEMRNSGLGVVRQREIVVFYADVMVGEYTVHLIVEDQVIVELKVVGALSDLQVPRCRNDLRTTGKPLCLPVDFGQPKVEIRCISAQPDRDDIPFIPLHPVLCSKRHHGAVASYVADLPRSDPWRTFLSSRARSRTKEDG